MSRFALFAVVILLAVTCQAAVVFDPVPDIPSELEGLSPQAAHVNVYTADEIGPMPRPYSDISQGAETGDPNFYIEMSDMLGAMGGKLVRCDPFSQTSYVTVSEDGEVQIDFTAADAICDALARAGAKPCWNIASFPDEMLKDEKPIPELLDQFVYKVTYHWNVEQKRGIQYFEYWNEPPSLDGDKFAVAVKAAHRADPTVKVGGPAIMGCSVEVLEKAVKYCVANNVDIGFLSFHLYYQMPQDYLGHILGVREMLKNYPGLEDLEFLITEWGVDAGLSGSCDTLYNAAYYSSILQTVMDRWPRVRPMHFEFRDGWDGVGPSRDLWGRWGMVTYPNLLPKPVYNAGVMWNRLASTQVKAESSDPGVRVLAAKDDHQVTLLIWSWPKEYERLLADSPQMKISPLDTPVRIRVDDIPFASPGVRYQRYVVDQTHSNVNFDIHTADLQKVQDIILARTGPERGEAPEKGIPENAFETEIVLPLHSVTLIVLKPEDRPPVNVVAKSDKYSIWAGEKAKVTIEPKFDEDLELELVLDPANRSQWQIDQLAARPLSFHLRPPASSVKTMRYFNVWVRNKKSGAIGNAVLELQTDTPAYLSREPDHVDVSPVSRQGRIDLSIVNKTPKGREATLTWDCPDGITVEPARQTAAVRANGELAISPTVRFDESVTPDKYFVKVRLGNDVELDTLEIPVHLSLQCPRASRGITVDGDVSEWDGMPSVKTCSSTDFDGHSYREWGGEEDVCGRIWTAWDEKHLYFAFRVLDDQHIQKINTWEMKDFDAVHLGFDLGRDSTDPNIFFDDGDCDYVLGFMDKQAYAYRHWGAKRRMGPADGVKIAARQSGRITTYEIAMDWEVEFVPYAKPKEGEVIGCSVYFTDNDEGKHKAEMRWGRGLSWHQKRPALFNSIYLTK